jgi:hypothetical protein
LHYPPLQLQHNERLVLQDAPYRYALEYANEEEAEFPELFQPQLERREAAARDEARKAHLRTLRLTSGQTAAPARLTVPE